MLEEYITRQDVEAVLDGLRQVAVCRKNTHIGLCTNLIMACDDTVPENHTYRILYHCFACWDEYSGCALAPIAEVPSYWLSTGTDRWDTETEVGRARHRLLKHCIATCEALLAEQYAN